ncbi:MAG TPA: L-threonylcarbamoyladenylate synthase [Acetobacteraceae bacterium]|jgi:L-threonylcarbamoyladenylate synthase
MEDGCGIETEYLRADHTGIARAAALLRAGRLVAFGTETVYGLGADATNAEAVARIFAAKQRPRFNPLICHYPDADTAFAHVVPNDAARCLAAVLWPGPLTLVLPRRPDCPVALLTGAGLDTLAVRVPAHGVALALLRALGRPVAAPSANRSGQVSPTTARHVFDGLGERIDAVLDCGPCAVGVESTVLDLAGPGPRLLRPGGVTLETIEALIGAVSTDKAPGGALRSPGMLASHYAPASAVRLNARDVGPDEALLAFGTPLPGAGVTFNLSERGDPTEAAARLFTGLRLLDAEVARRGLSRIAVMPVPANGLGLAINDRLSRAASPRD